jgi:hypothetical protein
MPTQINPYSKFGYLAISKESTEATAVKPTIYSELLSEDLIVNYNRQMVQPIAGKIDMNLRSVPDKITIEGSVTATIDPKNVGYILSHFFGAPTTTTIQAGKVFKHVFTPQETPPTYTWDVRPAGASHVKRYFGVKLASVEISQVDNKMQITANVFARKAFTESRITEATVSATQFHVDQTSGLTTSDIVEFRDRADMTTVNGTASVASIVSETVLTVATAQTVSLKDVITIQKSTTLYTTSNDLTWIGGAKYGDGDDIDNAETANNTEDATFTFTREGEERHSAEGCDLTNRFPKRVFLKGYNSEGSITHFFESPKFSDRMRAGEKTALRTRICGKKLDTNSAQTAVLLIGSIGDASAVRCTSSVASETSNNLNVTIQANTVDTLEATKTGNNILVKKASTDTTKNTATLVATAINGLTGVTAGADGAGTGEVALLTKTNFGSGTNQIGRDANEKEQLIVDQPDSRFQPFNQPNSEDNIITEEITYNSQYDTISAFTTRIILKNDIASYA